MMGVSIPHDVLVASWIPFAVVIVLTFIFAWVYIRLFQHHQLSEVSSTMTSIFGLFIVMLTSALVPVDVFLVSLMKEPDGTFKPWVANNETRQVIENTVTYTYYTLYALVAVFIFMILPFMYFYYEDRDDDRTTKQRCCTGFKYMLGFVFIAAVVLLTGAFVPLKQPPANMTIDNKFAYLKQELEQYSHPEKAMSIMIGVISMFGMMTLIMYTGYGMSALPLGMIRCCKKFKSRNAEESARRLTRHERDLERMRMIRAKQNSGRNLTRFERNELFRIEKDEQVQTRYERRKRKMRTTVCGKIQMFLKPFEVVFGLFFFSVSLLIMVSLIMTSIDKGMHSSAKVGYALTKPTLPNPVNFVMMYAQKVFPLDYILFAGMAIFFIFASMSGMKRMGIWCCCIKMYKIRVGRTMPQALIFMVFILMFMVLSLNIILFTVTPQYLQYGNQKYQVNVTSTKTVNGTKLPIWKMTPTTCTTSAPADECVMSRLALILNTLWYRAWFFGAFYYWTIWLFIGVYCIGLVVSLVKLCRKRVEEEMIVSSDDDGDDDSDASDGRLIRA